MGFLLFYFLKLWSVCDSTLKMAKSFVGKIMERGGHFQRLEKHCGTISHHPLSLERTAEGVRGKADRFQPLESKPLRKIMQSAFLLNYRTDPLF